MKAYYESYNLAEDLVNYFDNEIIYDVVDTKDCYANIHFDAHLDEHDDVIIDVIKDTEHYPAQVNDGSKCIKTFKLTIDCISKIEDEIGDN